MIALAPDEARALPAALDELRLLLVRRGAPEATQRLVLRALPPRTWLPSEPADLDPGVTAVDAGLLLDGLALCCSMLADPRDAGADALLRLSRLARAASIGMMSHLT